MFTMPDMDVVTITDSAMDVDTWVISHVTAPGGSSSRLTQGEAVFLTHERMNVSRAAKKGIDWDGMRRDARKKAEKNADEAGITGESERAAFIAAREAVHFRPSSFIGKDGVWRDEDSMDDDLDKSIALYTQSWEDAVHNAQPDDVFAHWHRDA